MHYEDGFFLFTKGKNRLHQTQMMHQLLVLSESSMKIIDFGTHIRCMPDIPQQLRGSIQESTYRKHCFISVDAGTNKVAFLDQLLQTQVTRKMWYCSEIKILLFFSGGQNVLLSPLKLYVIQLHMVIFPLTLILSWGNEICLDFGL